MTAFNVIATVTEDHRLVIDLSQLPIKIPPGEYKALLTFEDGEAFRERASSESPDSGEEQSRLRITIYLQLPKQEE